MFKTASSLAALSLMGLAQAKDAVVFLGCSGDNALRESGVWHGLYEAYASGVYETAGGIDIFCATNAPETDKDLRGKMLATLSPLYAKLKGNSAWACKVANCDPASFIQSVTINVHKGYDSCAQAASMKAGLAGAGVISVYLSIPPSVFGEWSKCAADSWGAKRVHIAAEKPFGTSLDNAVLLQSQITAAISDDHLHLVDHWLSFFMNKNLPTFRPIVEKALGLPFNRSSFSKIVVTEFEVRGLGGRGSFFDGVGQARDMVQSHLLQVLALALVEPAEADNKFEILNATSVKDCTFGQYDGFLQEPGLKYHPTFADATLIDTLLDVRLPEWYGVPVHIVTGKDMGLLKYTVELWQRDGPGLLTYEIGKEETGVAGIKVSNWPIVDYSSFSAPVGGFDDTQTTPRKPNVSAAGDGYLLDYTSARMYFPCPYAVMIASLLENTYSKGFATFPECKRGWEIITATAPDVCMDPVPEDVPVYQTPDQCGQTPPDVCYQVNTVKDEYDVTYACSPEHDAMYTNTSFYQAKCHPSV